MKFTENEMVFFNSITDGESLFGIPITFRIKSSQREEIDKTISSLAAKGVLEKESKLSKKGALPASAIEDYKNAKKYVIINYLHIAITDKDAVVIIPLKNFEYEVMRIPTEAIMVMLLKKYEILCRKTNGQVTENKYVNIDNILRELNEKRYSSIILGIFENDKTVNEYVYFWDDINTYRYDFKKQIKSKIDPVIVRKEIAGALSIGD